jgi:predicted alpha-1,2-mannosidase
VTTTVPEFQSGYAHSGETATAGYYQVHLTRWDVNAELTATDHSGVAQFTYPAGKPANILLPISHTLNHATAAYVKVVGDRRIEGYVINQLFCGKKDTYKVYFVMTFNKPFTSFGTWNGNHYGGPGVLEEKSRTALELDHDQWIGAYASWPAAAQTQTITAKVAISYVDLAGADKNLMTETAGKSFSVIHKEAVATWNKALGAIDVSGGSDTNRTVFYSALYHSLLMPTIFSDADGRYLGFDDKIHSVGPGHAVYANYSGWDIYRSEMPLVALIDPVRMEDMAQSIVLMYKQGGWIDRWPEANKYTNVMAGSPLSVVLATAWVDGLHGFDMKTGWEGMWKDATEAPPAGHAFIGEEGIDWINKVHFVPDDKVKYGSVSQMQEDGAAYASLYWLAKAMGKTADAKTMYDKALDYRNEFDAQDRMFRPRNADGSWVEGFDPAKEHGFIEGSGWHYQWMAQWDMAWLVKAMGTDLFNQRLTEFFNYPKPGWYGQYYNPYNETDLEAPFEFNFSGQPWQTQRVVRRVLKENYTNTFDGLPGNDDCGAMSSWAVFSMMGIYSVDPASLAYELVSPVFPKIVVHLHAPYAGKAFMIETTADPEATPYIQSVELNGKAHAANWISYKDIVAGGTLKFALGADANKSWGAAAADAPPSVSDQQP